MSDAPIDTDDDVVEETAPDESPPVDAAVEEEPVVEAELLPEESVEEAAEAVEVDMLAAIGQVEKQRDDYLDALQRLQADFENYKKRMMRQQSELVERSGFDLVEKLLPVLDAIDLAKQHGAGAGDGDAAGKALEQISTQLLDVLGKEGLERVDPVGQEFDPNEHEAVAHEDGDGDSESGGPTVSGLMRAGWRWRGRLVRPAMVTVKG